MAKMDQMEKLAREICWAGFTHRDARCGKTKAGYWKSITESARQNYRAEARQFARLYQRVSLKILNSISSNQ